MEVRFKRFTLPSNPINDKVYKDLLKIPLYINDDPDPIILNIPYQPERLNPETPSGGAIV